MKDVVEIVVHLIRFANRRAGRLRVEQTLICCIHNQSLHTDIDFPLPEPAPQKQYILVQLKHRIIQNQPLPFRIHANKFTRLLIEVEIFADILRVEDDYALFRHYQPVKLRLPIAVYQADVP